MQGRASMRPCVHASMRPCVRRGGDRCLQLPLSSLPILQVQPWPLVLLSYPKHPPRNSWMRSLFPCSTRTTPQNISPPLFRSLRMKQYKYVTHPLSFHISHTPISFLALPLSLLIPAHHFIPVYSLLSSTTLLYSKEAAF